MSKSRTTTRAGGKPAFEAMPVARLRRPPTHPGEIFRVEFREAIEPRVSQAEAARRLGWSLNRMNEFEVGKRALTPENAIALAALTGTEPEFWLTLQMRLDLWTALQATKGRKVLVGDPISSRTPSRTTRTA